jgi:hypothetical protein
MDFMIITTFEINASVPMIAKTPAAIMPPRLKSYPSHL